MLEGLNALLIVWGAYLLAIASPGPSNMAIMAIAMRHGRPSALAFVAGVLCGSMTWAFAAAAGLSAALAAWAQAIFVIKIAGGLYLLWLAVKSARSAWRGSSATLAASDEPRPAKAGLFRSGLLLHLSNPKAILGWLAIMSLLMGDPVAARHVPMAIAGCACLGVIVFGGYAALFSTAPAIRAYRRLGRWIDAAVAGAFGFAGYKLLTSRV